ncbi:tRNA pseudouridine(55) synthase TruB [Effusibacillus dendaii]|uniref:tRNA pseudouridine synthase B n=1 Tax=Effusibacillus dendaii TaxID=2743772 RepID=A0A7I8D8G4_9BACL|nr:tRNA pseudouridine(55) synthase TruB [Effusibacillus dendaii]BCJ85309.1 tRNA pseudouridine(55) synthase TruB [Effusibacillus dendaii]
MNGILVINKPKGMTSQQVVGRLRRLLCIKKIGHTGTLDPDVDGVLPICIGHATRIAEYMLDQDKAYRGELTFGFATDTQDASGQVIESVDSVSLTEEQIRSVFNRFQGVIEQIPPAYSAVKVDGKRAYDLARQGKQVDLPVRQVTIYSIHIESITLNLPYPKVCFEVECSKGTYIRTLCHDIGKMAGVPAHMSALTRIRSGPFRIESAHTLETIEEAVQAGEIDKYLLSPTAAISHFPIVRITGEQLNRVCNGRPMAIPMQNRRWQTGDRICLETEDNRLVAIYRIERTNRDVCNIKPEKVFKQ